MAVVTRTLSVPPETVFEVLSDGWLYGLWVVGTSHIRDVDNDWPAVGAKLYHAFGAWPAVIRDESEVLESDPPRRLVLAARAWPAGQARIEVTLEPEGSSGCRVSLDEFPVTGIGKVLHNPLFDSMIHRRNVETLSRLAALADRRQPRL
jgi:uncharacterized protein YndB with AHSA1/START domain